VLGTEGSFLISLGGTSDTIEASRWYVRVAPLASVYCKTNDLVPMALRMVAGPV
jgi:hypothetical protein